PAAGSSPGSPLLRSRSRLRAAQFPRAASRVLIVCTLPDGAWQCRFAANIRGAGPTARKLPAGIDSVRRLITGGSLHSPRSSGYEGSLAGSASDGIIHRRLRFRLTAPGAREGTGRSSGSAPTLPISAAGPGFRAADLQHLWQWLHWGKAAGRPSRGDADHGT